MANKYMTGNVTLIIRFIIKIKETSEDEVLKKGLIFLPLNMFTTLFLYVFLHAHTYSAHKSIFKAF